LNKMLSEQINSFLQQTPTSFQIQGNSIPVTQTNSSPEVFPIFLSGVSKRYGKVQNGKWALRDVSFVIEPGIFGLLGCNGAGKTTLLQILATLLEATSGSIHIGPYDVPHQRWAIRSRVGLGFLPQEQGYYPKLTVTQTLRYLAALQGLEQPQRHIDRVLEAVNLSDRTRSRVSTLSGGMRRRLGLAQALLGDPRVVIVDEPTTGLDPVEQQRFRMLLGTLGAQGNRTIILSTHIVADVATVAGRLAVLEKGQLAFQGSVTELAARARGYSWLWRTTIDVVEAARRERPLLITSLTPVTDGTGTAHEVIARVEGMRPAPEAIPCEPTLEDGYFSIIGGTDQDDDYRQHLATKLRDRRHH
jgi:ABC-type multidrug transport system ATPase subunit